jgi:hypothetical protein
MNILSAMATERARLGANGSFQTAQRIRTTPQVHGDPQEQQYSRVKQGCHFFAQSGHFRLLFDKVHSLEMPFGFQLDRLCPLLFKLFLSSCLRGYLAAKSMEFWLGQLRSFHSSVNIPVQVPGQSF